MTNAVMEQLAQRITGHFSDTVTTSLSQTTGELTVELADSDRLLAVCTQLRDQFGFESMIDLAGVDYSDYGLSEWKTQDASESGFSRAVSEDGLDKESIGRKRYAVVYHLLSVSNNQRLRLRAYCADETHPALESVIDVWPGANWYEREAFDLFGILFKSHPDLRRLLTDYGFIGHPFRKDFPLIGNVEVRYDPEKGRVVYQPVSIEARTLVPKVIRDDNRYSGELTDRPFGADSDA